MRLKKAKAVHVLSYLASRLFNYLIDLFGLTFRSALAIKLLNTWRKRKHGIAFRFQLSFIGFLCRTVFWLFLLLVFFLHLWLFENCFIHFTSYHITVQLVFVAFIIINMNKSSFSFSSSNRQKENQRITNTQTFIFHELLTSKFSHLTCFLASLKRSQTIRTINAFDKYRIISQHKDQLVS